MNDSNQNKTAIYDGEKGFLLLHILEIYILISEIFGQPKKIIKILHPLLVLPVNLWHDSWTGRAAVSAYPKLPPPPEEQSHSLYFSKSKWLKLFILTVHSRDHPLCFYCARCLPLTLHSDPKTPGLLSHTCSRKKNPALQNFFSRSHLICIPRELTYCVPLVRNSCYLG